MLLQSRSICLSIFVLSAILQCSTTQPKGDKGQDTQGVTVQKDKSDGKAADPDVKKTSETETLPDAVKEGDDAFFHAPAAGEIFRVLITKDDYVFRQLSETQSIRRRPDPTGDKEQLLRFQDFHERYDYKDATYMATLKVRLNPHSGTVEHLEYMPGKTPKSLQISRMLMDDIQRHRFVSPSNIDVLREFYISFECRVKRPASMSDDEAKKKAIEFLRKEREKNR